MTELEVFKTANNIVNEVEKMRKLQKEYFRTRNKQVLEDSKKQEKRVDDLIKNYKEPDLFIQF